MPFDDAGLISIIKNKAEAFPRHSPAEKRLTFTPTHVLSGTRKGQKAELILGDTLEIVSAQKENTYPLIITSPPYFIGKEYDTSRSSKKFFELHKKLLPELARILKPGGHLCIQVGYHADSNQLVPLDYLVHQAASEIDGLILRNRIIWTFRHGVNCAKRFSGRHEVILWYTKGSEYAFDLDSVRVPQLYPGKKHYRGDRKGQHSGNPLGKNPGDVWEEPSTDVWDIPNVKAKHPEKTTHPCQFPTALVSRLIKALCPKKGVVLDPFAGSGSAGVAAIVEGRSFVGIDNNDKYLATARDRLLDALNGKARVREDMPVRQPIPTESVAQRPKHFRGSKSTPKKKMLIRTETLKNPKNKASK